MNKIALHITDDPIAAGPGEGGAFERLAQRIKSIYDRRGSAQLLDEKGNATSIPDTALQALGLLADKMAHGQALTLVDREGDLTTQQAADLLHVSRPHVIKLLDRGDIPSHKVGSHRRVHASDLLAYRAKRDTLRRQKLDELARISEELPGGYR